MKDPMKMLRQVQQMQDRMAKAQKELEEETVEATSGGGAVRVVATGAQKVVIAHADLQSGQGCPACEQGKVYHQKEPKPLVRIVGQAP